MAASTYVDRTGRLLVVKVDLRDRRARDEMVITPVCDRTIVRSRSAVTGLVPAFDGDRAVECAVGIAAAGLRLRP